MTTDPEDATPTDDVRSLGDEFTRDRFAWIDQVLSDRELPLFALHIAMALLKNFNRGSREAFPHQKTIADKLGASRNGVGNAIAQLASAGHIEVIAPSGRRGGNRYRMVLRQPQSGSTYANGGGHKTDGYANDGGHKIDVHANGGGHKQHRYANGGGHEPEVYANDGGHNGSTYANGGGHLMPTAVGINNTVIEQLDTSLRSVPARTRERTHARETVQGTRIPEDWELDEDGRRYAERRGLSADAIEREAEEFRDYWLAKDGPDALKRSWPAAWRRWCREAIDRQQRALTLLRPIAGGRQSHGSNHAGSSRPRSGGLSAMAVMDTHPSRRQESY